MWTFENFFSSITSVSLIDEEVLIEVLEVVVLLDVVNTSEVVELHEVNAVIIVNKNIVFFFILLSYSLYTFLNQDSYFYMYLGCTIPPTYRNSVL